MSELLDQEAIDKRLDKLSSDWFQTGDNHLAASFEFTSHEDAHSFIDCVAKAATKLDHHPSISWQYKTVIINVTTHEVDGITNKDFELAESVQPCQK